MRAWFITRTNNILLCVVRGVRRTVFNVRHIVLLECILQAMDLPLGICGSECPTKNPIFNNLW
jgi:hypothetical protein